MASSGDEHSRVFSWGWVTVPADVYGGAQRRVWVHVEEGEITDVFLLSSESRTQDAHEYTWRDA